MGESLDQLMLDLPPLEEFEKSSRPINVAYAINCLKQILASSKDRIITDRKLIQELPFKKGQQIFDIQSQMKQLTEENWQLQSALELKQKQLPPSGCPSIHSECISSIAQVSQKLDANSAAISQDFVDQLNAEKATLSTQVAELQQKLCDQNITHMNEIKTIYTYLGAIMNKTKPESIECVEDYKNWFCFHLKGTLLSMEDLKCFVQSQREELQKLQAEVQKCVQTNAENGSNVKTPSRPSPGRQVLQEEARNTQSKLDKRIHLLEEQVKSLKLSLQEEEFRRESSQREMEKRMQEIDRLKTTLTDSSTRKKALEEEVAQMKNKCFRLQKELDDLQRTQKQSSS